MGERNSATPFHLNLTPFLPQFYLILTFFQPKFYLNLTSAQPAISNHGLETTVYIPLAITKKSGFTKFTAWGPFPILSQDQKTTKRLAIPWTWYRSISGLQPQEEKLAEKKGL